MFFTIITLFFSNQGKYDDAMLLYKRALTIVEAKLDPRRPDVTKSLHNLAVLLESQVMWYWSRSFDSTSGISYVNRVEAERRT